MKEQIDLNRIEDPDIAERAAYIEKPYRDQSRGGEQLFGVGTTREINEKMSEIVKGLGLEKEGLTYENLSEEKRNELYREATRLLVREPMDAAAARLSESYIEVVSKLPESEEERVAKIELLKKEVEAGIGIVVTALNEACPNLGIDNHIVELPQKNFEEAVNDLAWKFGKYYRDRDYGDADRRFRQLSNALRDYKQAGDALEKGELVAERNMPYVAITVEEQIKEARQKVGI